jgi:hypothetical protein
MALTVPSPDFIRSVPVVVAIATSGKLPQEQQQENGFCRLQHFGLAEETGTQKA